MKNFLFTLSLIVGIYSYTFAQYKSPLIALDGFNNNMYIIDTSNFNILNTISTTITTGQNITGYTGMAVKSDGTILAVVRGAGFATRSLVSINPNTGVITLLGEIGSSVVSIALKDDNTLFGITGGASGTYTNSLIQIDVNTGAATLLANLTTVNGATISYSPDDNLLYYWQTSTMNTITTSAPYTVTNIPTTGYSLSNYIFCASYIGNNTFMMFDGNSDILWATTTGLITEKTPSQGGWYRGMVMYPFYTISSNDPLSFCPGGSTSLIATSLGTSYQWTLNGADISGANSNTYITNLPGSYNCKISIAGVVDTAMSPLVVIENPLPVVALAPSGSSAFCQGDAISVTITGTTGGNSQWYLNGVAISGETSNTYAATTPGLYNMIKTNSNGCSDSAAVGIVVIENPLPVVNLTPSGSTAFCQGDAISVTITGTTGGNSQWYLNGVAISGETSNTYAATTPGLYNMIKTNSNGCSDSAAVGIVVIENPLPVVNLTPSGSTAFCQGDAINVTITGTTGGTSQWYLNGVAIAGETTNTYSATTPGLYNMIKTNSNGCSDSATVGIVVIENPLPNVTLTPSGSTAFCQGDAAISITGGSPLNGIYSGTGVSGGFFDPAVAGLGVHIITYSYTDMNGCTSSNSVNFNVDNCISLNSLQNKSQLTIYPNPSIGSVNIESTILIESVQIHSELGQVLFDFNVNNQPNFTIPTTNISKGTYTLRIKMQNGSFSYRSLIIQ
jgi:hypothetical protein